FQRYYIANPDPRFTHPNCSVFASPSAGNTATVSKRNNHTYLLINTWGLGDVYELPNADGIVLNNQGVVGTVNGKIPLGIGASGPFYGDPVGFTATTGAVAPMTLTWDFGDGTTAAGTTGVPITHRFAGTQAGTSLTPTVKATNVSDSSITASAALTVLKPT